MKYENIVEAVFLSRPNRFIAYCELDGETVVCHVKNTGRCRELLIPGSRVYLQHFDSTARKTAYDLIAVWKGDKLINMDANAPNAVFHEYLAAGHLGFKPELIRRECVHGESRLDFYYEHGGVRSFAEIKGVTLEDNGVVLFPDAPTERGVKHLHTLINCVREGYESSAVFVVQLYEASQFEPNRATHPEFAEALAEARDAGVKLLALRCRVSPQSLEIIEEIPIIL